MAQTQWIKYLTRQHCFDIEAALNAELAQGWEILTIFHLPWKEVFDTQPNTPKSTAVDPHASEPHYNAVWYVAFLTRKDAPPAP